jgi:hypothetical protein
MPVRAASFLPEIDSGVKHVGKDMGTDGQLSAEPGKK